MSNWNDLLSKIFNHNYLRDNPPVLFDIGASGEIFSEWKDIAKYAICVAFDADDRDMKYAVNEQSKYKKLYVVNRIVVSGEEKEVDFYLTASPYCSSLLKPDGESLTEWSFADLFNVNKIVKLQTVNLRDVLHDLKIKQIDWFKTDSQGTDLQLFQSIKELQANVIVTNFEPGFIDAYIGENKIADLIQYMEKLPFWLCRFVPRGTKRLNISFLNQYLDNSKIQNIENSSVDSACWAEITYLNKFMSVSKFSAREYLLGCVFSIMLKQYGFAAELALKGKIKSQDTIFDEVLAYIKNITKPNSTSLKSRIINFTIRKLQLLS